MASTTTAESVRRRPRAASSWVDRNVKWILVAPGIFVVLALTVFPLLFSIWTSFVQFDFSLGEEHPWVGLDNFRIVWEDPVWRRSLYITAALAAGATLIELALGLILALAMLRPFRARRILMVLFVIPLFVSPVIVGMFFDLFLRRPQGPANQIVSWVVPGQTPARAHGRAEPVDERERRQHDERRGQDEIQKLTDRHIAEIDKLLQVKEAELIWPDREHRYP